MLWLIQILIDGVFLLFQVLWDPHWVVWHSHARFQRLGWPFDQSTADHVVGHVCHFSEKSDEKRLLRGWERVIQAWGEYGVIY